jgi:adenylate cyclase
MFTLGVRGRLFLAFFGISAFTVIAAATAVYSFLVVGNALERVIQLRVPSAIASLQLSRQAERIVAAAPALLTVTTTPERKRAFGAISAEVDRLESLLRDLEQRGTEPAQVEDGRRGVQQLRANLDSLGALIAERLAAADTKATLLGRLVNTHQDTQRLLGPGLLVAESSLSGLRNSVNDLNLDAEERSARIARLVNSLTASPQLHDAQAAVLTINGALLQAATAERVSDLAILGVVLDRSLNSLTKVAQNLDPTLSSSLLDRAQVFRSFASDPDGIVETRRRELDLVTKGQLLLAQNAEVSSRLTNIVSNIVAQSELDIAQANMEAVSIQRVSIGVLIAVVALTIISSTLIVWLYVGRNIIARLTELSASMESVASGDLKVQLPSDESSDEIGRMTKALIVFRDTAVEIEESSLREIGQARQRLLDAIESISEGFCYFDSNDKLVVANSNFRALMHPGEENTPIEGMTFEQLVRWAADKGYVRDAEGRVDEWVAERVAQHRHPGAPGVQQRADGRWIMISERKTGDGGTVAIYSDITELKQRETELTEKSKSMENLSNQIAKYLSPQIYESIFTGKQEVKVSSHRRKLTIFFSDIAGFTETAEQLESEDLTKLLNHYLTEMSAIALAHGATIDKYVGDAIVIFFGDPETRGIKEDALACVKMAIAMRRKMTELQDIWSDSGIAKPLQCRIGINTGFCTVGNFGSEDRLDYTIIGSGVNLASRLESAASPGEILISYETYALVKDQIHCGGFGEITVKGISHPIQTYQVVDAHEDLEREREMIQDIFPNYNLTINLDELSPDQRSRAVISLNRALDQLGQSKDVKITAVEGPEHTGAENPIVGA